MGGEELGSEQHFLLRLPVSRFPFPLKSQPQPLSLVQDDTFISLSQTVFVFSCLRSPQTYVINLWFLLLFILRSRENVFLPTNVNGHTLYTHALLKCLNGHQQREGGHGAGRPDCSEYTALVCLTLGP